MHSACIFKGLKSVSILRFMFLFFVRIFLHLQPTVSEVFGVTSEGVLYTKIVLDREQCSIYNFSVCVADQGSPPLTGSIRVVVVVVDLNDERPTFSQTHYSFSLNENLPTGTLVGAVTARDPDMIESAPDQTGSVRLVTYIKL